MKTSHAVRAVLKPEAISPTKVQRNLTVHPQLLLSTPYPHEVRQAKRSVSWPHPITLREIAIVIGLVAIGLRALPHPLNFLTASVLAPAYFLTRMYPFLLRPLGLLGYLAWVVVPFLPAWITGEPSDFGLAKATLLFTSPGLARLVTWRDRTGRWDGLDPLVIASAPVAVGSIVVVIGRLFELGALSWN
jgi:hypothetical protein